MKTFLKYRTFCPTFTGFITDIPLNYDGHVYVIFFQCLSDIMSDVIRENVGHGVQNIGHVRMSDDFSYTLTTVIRASVTINH